MVTVIGHEMDKTGKFKIMLQNTMGNLREGDNLEDLVVEGNVILKCMLME
jgi:hypothetical protein